MCASDYKQKRVDYLNNWPNNTPFEIEENYRSRVCRYELSHGPVFQPFLLSREEDVAYNKTLSFLIDALDVLQTKPHHSYEFSFKAFDSFSKAYAAAAAYQNSNNITSRLQILCGRTFAPILSASPELKLAFLSMLSYIPMSGCRYISKTLFDASSTSSGQFQDIKAFKHVINIDHIQLPSNSNRKQLLSAVFSKYGYDASDYLGSIRPSGATLQYLLQHDSIVLGSQTFQISLEDKLHILLSGFLYPLRNGMMHGDAISLTGSSKTTLSTYATDYYAFLLTYYFTLILILDRFSADYPADKYAKLAENMDTNVSRYVALFGTHVIGL